MLEFESKSGKEERFKGEWAWTLKLTALARSDGGSEVVEDMVRSNEVKGTWKNVVDRLLSCMKRPTTKQTVDKEKKTISS